MPFLLPPPEFKPGELTQMQLTGTCEMQICRSAPPWSLGTTKTEHSIQNAYLKGRTPSPYFGGFPAKSAQSYPTLGALRIH